VMGAIVEHAHIAQDLKKFPKEIGIIMHVNLLKKVNIYFILFYNLCICCSNFVWNFLNIYKLLREVEKGEKLWKVG